MWSRVRSRPTITVCWIDLFIICLYSPSSLHLANDDILNVNRGLLLLFELSFDTFLGHNGYLGSHFKCRSRILFRLEKFLLDLNLGR